MADKDYRPTSESYGEIQRAYDFYNEVLFDGELPPCMITFVRIDRSYGYHAGKRWINSDGAMTDELALNPSYFAQRPTQRH